MARTRDEIAQLLASYKEALMYWQGSFCTSFSGVSSAKVASPLEELVKLAKLIKAHTTKVGIVFKPENLKGLEEAAYNVVQKLSETVVLLVSLVAQLEKKDVSKLLYDEILSQLSLIIGSNIAFAEELSALEKETYIGEKVDEKVDKDPNPTDKRLVSVGRIWASCDALVKLVEAGKLGLLASKTKQSIVMLDDGLDEFAEWAENPEEMDDPFGFSDDESDEEAPPKEDETHLDDEERTELIAYAKKWLEKVKLIKLLLTSLTRSLPTVTAGEDIDNIYTTQRTIVTLVDKLIVDLMMDQVVDEKTNEYAVSIDKACKSIVKTVKNANKNSENKVKWCVAWTAKYEELK